MDPSTSFRMTNAWSIIFANLEFRYMVAFTLAKVRLLIYSHNFVVYFSLVSSFSDTLCHFVRREKLEMPKRKISLPCSFFDLPLVKTLINTANYIISTANHIISTADYIITTAD